ncbi:oligoribonuclease [Vibrio parahaemolyticus]|uniref:oligoribonuclease n=1 Tax=Vibrio parahaemolyticus TaxID=670 RepID=UPI0009E5096E|nr:oligoribonuclease [Vibrio parahaemolyticus]
MTYFAWLDYETGGLNGRLDNGHLGMDYYPIFEVAMIVTDSQLNQVGEPLRLVVHQFEDSISQCSQWAIDTHTKSGLLDEVRTSTLSLRDAEVAIISHLKNLGIPPYDRKKKSGAILAGSSIMFDRTFMMCQMPELSDYLHYRQLDVSAFNLAVRAFKPEIEQFVQKQYKHEALSDIQETIDEFKVYRSALFDDHLSNNKIEILAKERNALALELHQILVATEKPCDALAVGEFILDIRDNIVELFESHKDCADIYFKPKFSIGDIVWGAFNPSIVTFDDRLPVVELKVKDIKFSGVLHENGQLKVDLTYVVEELNGWTEHGVRERELFCDKRAAEKEAYSLTEAEMKRFEQKYLQASKMLKSTKVDQ